MAPRRLHMRPQAAWKRWVNAGGFLVNPGAGESAVFMAAELELAAWTRSGEVRADARFEQGHLVERPEGAAT
jgi:hypothetical protein